LLLRFYRQHAVIVHIHAKMDVDALVYGDSDGPRKGRVDSSQESLVSGFSLVSRYRTREAIFRLTVSIVRASWRHTLAPDAPRMKDR